MLDEVTQALTMFISPPIPAAQSGTEDLINGQPVVSATEVRSFSPWNTTQTIPVRKHTIWVDVSSVLASTFFGHSNCVVTPDFFVYNSMATNFNLPSDNLYVNLCLKAVFDTD